MVLGGRVAEADAEREQRLRHRRKFLAQGVQPRFVAGSFGAFMEEQRLDGALSAHRAAGQKAGLETAFGFDDELADRGRSTVVDGQEDGRGNVWHTGVGCARLIRNISATPISAEAARIRLRRLGPATILQSEAHS